MNNRVTTVIVNYQTPDLLTVAVESFKKHYPEVPLIIFDNGSRDNSREHIEELISIHENTVAHYESDNIFHGPAIHKAVTDLVETDFCFILDSDTETLKPGFLEEGISILQSDEKLYAIGHLEYSNKRGFKQKDGIPVILTPYLLMKVELYHKFPPFIHHGQPTINNFLNAQKAGYTLKHFPMYDFIDHKWRGTASKFGYKLGLKGKINYVLNKIGL